MRTILIATDFSEAARRAAMYGLQLAKAFNARIILLHAYQRGPMPLSDSLVIINPGDLAELVHRQLQEEVACLGVENDIPIQVLGEEGPAAETILNVAYRLKADLVVCGMKGEGKRTRKVFGSAVTDMTRKTRVPLLVIPESVKFESPRVLALADDIHPDADVHVLDMLRSIAQRFHSKLFMINVVKDPGEKDRGKKDAGEKNAGEKNAGEKNAGEVRQPGLHLPGNLRKVLQTLDPIYESPAGEDVNHVLQEAVISHDVNMLAMIPHPQSLFSRWLKGSHTRDMIFETSIPLLVLPDIRRRTPLISLFHDEEAPGIDLRGESR